MKTMKIIPSKTQNEIIQDHQNLIGSENFIFIPESNGKTVIAVNKYSHEVTKINKTTKNKKT